MANPVKAQKIKGNIWEYVVGKKQEDQEAKGHPAPFPCELVRDHISSWTNPGDVVLSPFAGIGSEGHVALQMGRRFVGVELKSSYYQQASKNLARALSLTQDLFAA